MSKTTAVMRLTMKYLLIVKNDGCVVTYARFLEKIVSATSDNPKANVDGYGKTSFRMSML